jgi:hypothetical protein
MIERRKKMLNPQHEEGDDILITVDGRPITFQGCEYRITAWRVLGIEFEEYRVLYDLVSVNPPRTLDPSEAVVDGGDYVTARKAACT